MFIWTREHRITPAQFLKVTDGDTFWFMLDTSYHQRAEWPFRLDKYDAWEKKDILGPAAIQFAKDWFTFHINCHRSKFPFLIFSKRESKFSEFEAMTLGRFVGEIICEQHGSYGPALAAAGLIKS